MIEVSPRKVTLEDPTNTYNMCLEPVQGHDVDDLANDVDSLCHPPHRAIRLVRNELLCHLIIILRMLGVGRVVEKHILYLTRKNHHVSYATFDPTMHTNHSKSPLVLRAVTTNTRIKRMTVGETCRQGLIPRTECSRIRDDFLHKPVVFHRNNRRHTVRLRPIITFRHARFFLHVFAHTAGDDEGEMCIDGLWSIVLGKGTEE